MMSDMIRRGDVVNAIASLVDTMSVCLNKSECSGMRSMKARAILTVQEDVPAVDAVEVVRCRECKRWERLEFSPLHFCPEVHEFTDAEFFCKYGKRRKDGDGDV